MLVDHQISERRNTTLDLPLAQPRWSLPLHLSTTQGLVGTARTQGLIHQGSFQIVLWHLRIPPSSLSSSV